MPTARRPAQITVLAGVNGAGKSSVAGAILLANGAMFYNPDEITRQLEALGLSHADANGRAWAEGRRLLEEAIHRRLDFAFETTLGGDTMTALLLHAAAEGLRVRLLYVGLTSVELHLQRVRERVARGGHDIPTTTIRARWRTSRENLIRLLPHLAELLLWDNSAESDPESTTLPTPKRLLWMQDGVVRERCPLEEVPRWARAIVGAVMR